MPRVERRPIYDPARYTDDENLPRILPPMASPFDNAELSFALTPPNQDLIHGADTVLAFDLLARAGGRTFLMSSWRRDQAVCMEERAVYVGCTDCLKTHVLHKAVYMLTSDLNGRDGKRRRVRK
jgi:hypothetical protein